MSDTFIQLNTDGTGKKLDTRTEATNGEHRQVFVIGDPATNAGVAPVDATNGLAVDNKTLPPGAATAAKQPALGTAGSSSTDVITVQGIASGTPQNIAAASLPLPTGASTAANQATQNSSLSSLDTKTPSLGQATAANSSPVVLASDKNVQLGALDVSGTPTSVRTDSSGRLKISHGQPAATTATLGALNAIAAIASDGFSDANFYFSGTTVQTVTFEQSPDSTDGTNGTWYPVLAVNQGVVAAAATTAALTATHTYRVSAPGAAWIHAKTTAYTSGSSSVQMVITTAMAQQQVTNTPSTSAVTVTSTTVAAPAVSIAGLSIAKILSAASTNATNVKGAGASRVLGWELTNTTASAKFLKIFAKTTAPVPGTDTPVFTIAIPPNGTNSCLGTVAITIGTGLGYSITGAYLDNDTTAVAAGDVVGAFFYV